MHRRTWSLKPIPAQRYQCGWCGCVVSSQLGAVALESEMPLVMAITEEVVCVCPQCESATVLGRGRQAPGVPMGNPVASLPKDIETLYEEARRAGSVGAYTAMVLCCRKILMHVAVSKGAPAGAKFASYVEFL